MCDTCGCSDTGNEPHDHHHHHDGAPSSARSTVVLGEEVLSANDRYARENRAAFKRHGLYVVNVIGSPGCGKTTIVEALARRFGALLAVIEGDLQTRRDADRVLRAGSRAVQIETNGACHLDAHAVGHALEKIDTRGCTLLVIENVGNLVCPAAYDLGENEKIAVLSLPEGDDKILKYPSLFHRAGALVISKTDLKPHLDFSISRALDECRSINREFVPFQVSAKTGDGMDSFFDYLAGKAGFVV
jgi:hydrogenase nickel incorporation protein HypB